MHNSLKIIIILLFLLSLCIISCSENKEKSVNQEEKEEVENTIESDVIPEYYVYTRTIVFDKPLDQDQIVKGQSIFKSKCTLCHKLDEKFLGPPMNNIFELRSAEWLMNMILIPQEMVKYDSTARKLFNEYNKLMMNNQNLTEEDALNVLVYLRSIAR